MSLRGLYDEDGNVLTLRSLDQARADRLKQQNTVAAHKALRRAMQAVAMLAALNRFDLLATLIKAIEHYERKRAQ